MLKSPKTSVSLSAAASDRAARTVHVVDITTRVKRHKHRRILLLLRDVDKSKCVLNHQMRSKCVR